MTMKMKQTGCGIIDETNGFEVSINEIEITAIQRYTPTYIIGHYNPSVKVINIVSHTTHAVCVNFIHKWQDLQFKKSTPNNKFF